MVALRKGHAERVGALLDQAAHDGEVALPAREPERRAAVLVAPVDVGARREVVPHLEPKEAFSVRRSSRSTKCGCKEARLSPALGCRTRPPS